MAYSTPPTFSAGAVLTAAQMNAYVRDNWKAVGDAWTAYGSGASWTASTSNPSLGNGTWAGFYQSVGKLTHFRVSITMGSTTTYGTGTWRIALPVAPVNIRWRFLVDCLDTSGGTNWGGWGIWDSTNSVINIAVPATTAGNQDRGVTSAIPFTWATTDILTVSGTYEAA